MTDKQDIRVFKRDGLKCECRVIRKAANDISLYLVETPAQETWVFEDEFLPDGEKDMTLTYGIKIIKTWDELPPIVYAEGACFSTRILEIRYRKMEEALTDVVNQGLDASQCRNIAVEALK